MALSAAGIAKVRQSPGRDVGSAGNRLAVAAASVALVAAAWAVSRTWAEHRVSVSETAVLAALALTASWIRFADLPGKRANYAPTGLMIVIAALIGGPVTGLVAGLAGAHRYWRVWQACLFWSAVSITQGVAAGLIGISPLSTPLRALLAMSAESGLALLALALVQHVRRFPKPERILRTQCIGLAIELVVALPLVIILVDRFASSPALTLLALCSLLAVFALARIGRGRFLGQLAAERRLARRDALTGLLNRRGFEEAASAEHARVLRGGDSAGLLLLDFDRFHWINSAYDYAGGDLVLRAISQRLLAELRTSDLVGRWGGEELVVLAPALDPAALGVLAEKLRRVVRDLPVRIGEQEVTVTCSVGGAMLDPAASFEVALQRANRALKRAKLERDTAIVDSTHESRRRAGLETQTDSLTGLLNHQAFARLVLPREIERAINTRAPLALLLIDLDDFKPINDLYGHQVGDQVLTGVADTISAVIGRDDLVFRTGGDEFAALLPLDRKQAEEAAATIQGAIARRTFASEEQMPTSVARIEATIGITVLDHEAHPGANPDAALIAQDLLTAANNAVEEEKALKHVRRGTSTTPKR